MIRNKRKFLIVKLCLTQGWGRIKKNEKKIFRRGDWAPFFVALNGGRGSKYYMYNIQKCTNIQLYFNMLRYTREYSKDFKIPRFSHF